MPLAQIPARPPWAEDQSCPRHSLTHSNKAEVRNGSRSLLEEISRLAGDLPPPVTCNWNLARDLHEEGAGLCVGQRYSCVGKCS